MSKKVRAERPKVPKMPFSFRKHILPPLAGVLVMVGVLGALNGELIAARVHYHFSRRNPAAAVIVAQAPKATHTPVEIKADPSAPASIIIPSIDVHAPVVFDETSTVEWKVQLALRRGTVHYGDTAVPGKNGNVVIIGHSSGQPWAPGDYKWIFTLLDKVKVGDQIQVNYQGNPYVYQVTDTAVVDPDDMTVLTQTTEPTLSLITCTPVGTSKNRLVVHAKQISPAPVKPVTAATKPAAKPANVNLPGSDHSTSLWQTIKSWF
ncbi:MAG TPA: class D sortase [Bacillota bacterium]|nr:class D sortase [Bacillota bacterium]